MTFEQMLTGGHPNSLGRTVIDDIRNFVQLTDEIGTAGQPTAFQFADIAAAGFLTVVNLAMPDHEDSIADEGRIVTSFGMSYVHIPVPWDTPEPRHVLEFCRTVDAVRRPVFVHCIMNYRVSAFCYHYLRKVVGWSEAASRSPMFRTWTPNEVWQRVMSWSAKEIGV